MKNTAGQNVNSKTYCTSLQNCFKLTFFLRFREGLFIITVVYMLSKEPSNLNLLFIYTATKKKIKPETYIGSVFVFLIPVSPG